MKAGYSSTQVRTILNISKTRLNQLVNEELIEGRDYKKLNSTEFRYYLSTLTKLTKRKEKNKKFQKSIEKT